MTIYIITFLLLFSFAIIDATTSISNRTRQTMSIIVYLLLVIQVGLRWETGTDWNPYLWQFESLTSITPSYYSNAAVEYGYYLFIWIVKLLFNDYSVFLLLHAILFYFLIFNSFIRYAPYVFLSLLVFYATTMGMMGSNRQLIALAISIYALRYVIEKKSIHFFLFILVAISFHASAYIFIVYYFLNRNIKSRVLLIALSIVFIIYFLGYSQTVIDAFANAGDWVGGIAKVKSEVYIESSSEALKERKLSILSLFSRLGFLALFYYNRKELSIKIPYYNILLNGYIFGVLFYFTFANTLLIMVSRGSLYFNAMIPLLLSSQIILIRGNAKKAVSIFILLIISGFLFYQSIAPYPDLFVPYKGIFLNSDFHRSMY